MSMGHERRQFLHFHLSATISSQSGKRFRCWESLAGPQPTASLLFSSSDIPLLPFVSGRGHRGRDGHFILHWLDNKEMQFTVEATKLLIELRQKIGDLESEGIGTLALLFATLVR